MRSKTWVIGWGILVLFLFGGIGSLVYKVDPFIHYHAPDTTTYYYELNNERSQNDGICKYFAYDALITGTSMTENFKTSEFDEIFGVTSIKVPYSGGSYKEINDNLKNALSHNSELKIILRGLDMGKFFDESNKMRYDLGTYPTYLYDDNPYNDVNYLFSKDIIFNRVYPMILASEDENFTPGVTSFDDYSRWQYSFTFGKNTVYPDEIKSELPGEPVHLTESQKETIRENISQNVTSLAEQYPNVEFYYFFPPYSTFWWKGMIETGTVYSQIEAEKYIIELILEHDNIHLFSFNSRTDIITNLNNYKDIMHYGQWINSIMLKWMHDGDYQLTWDNYQAYLEEELEFFVSFDYGSLNDQEDYESDFYAAALLNEELTGAVPMKLFEETNGAQISVQSVDDYGYLVFDGRRIADDGQPTVYVYNDKNETVAAWSPDYADLDEEWYQYVLDITQVDGEITIVMNGCCADEGRDDEAVYMFRNVMLY